MVSRLRRLPEGFQNYLLTYYYISTKVLVMLKRIAPLALVPGLIVAVALVIPLRAQTPAFEVASVKPSNPDAGGGPGPIVAPAPNGPPPPGPPPPGGGGPGIPSARPPIQVEHRRFTARNFTLFGLILQAYDLKGCTGPAESTCAMISGGPGWIRSDKFDIDAKGPDSSPDYTMAQYVTGQAPELRLMLQTLLTDRFNLKLHREMKQLPVYVLTVTKSGANKNGAKLKESAEAGNGTLVWGMTRRPNGDAAVRLNGSKVSMPRFADSLASIVGRPVLDQTGLKGSFDFVMEYASDADAPGATPFAGPSMFTAFQEQLGLKLDATRAPIEVLAIDSVEKPSAN